MVARLYRWCLSVRGRKALAIKLAISGCMVAVFIHPALGQVMGVVGSLAWLWVDIEV